MSNALSDSAVAAWQRLYVDAADAAPSVAACVGAAFRLADQVWRQVAADPTLDAATRRALTAGQPWAHTALNVYQYLIDSRAYTHLDLPAAQNCAADPGRLRAWLHDRTSAPEATPHVDEDFSWDADGVGAIMTTLIRSAQASGVFGVPSYDITLRQVTTDDPDTFAIIEHQVTLTTPAGATLASAPIPADHLADDDTVGLDAALAVLTSTATIVDELLAAERRVITTGTAPRLADVPGPIAARPNRGFAALQLHPQPTVASAGLDGPPARTDRHPRR